MRKKITSLLEALSLMGYKIIPEKATDADWMNCSTSFYIGKSRLYQTNIGGRELFIESRMQIDETTAWVVVMDNTWVLGKDDEFHYEPMPSSRDDEFIDLTRFDTKEEAFTAYIQHEQRTKPTRLTV